MTLATLRELVNFWTNTQPVVGTPVEGYALPVRAKYAVVKLDYTGSPSAAITLNVLGSLDGLTWATLGSFTELVDTVKRFDCESYKFITAVIAVHTTPQNTTLSMTVGEN